MIKPVRPKRLRRCQLSVPGSSEKMMTKAVVPALRAVMAMREEVMENFMLYELVRDQVKENEWSCEMKSSLVAMLL